MKLDFYNEARKIWNVRSAEGEIERLSFELQIHKRILSICQVGDFYYFIFNINRGEFEFVSPEIHAMLGFDPQTISADYFLSHIHPEDQPYFLNFEKRISEFFTALEVDKIDKYKIRYDFRIRDTHGKYIRLLHQMVVIQHNEDGNMVKTLGIHTDISHLKETGKPMLSMIGLEGEPSFVDMDVNAVFKPSKSLLSGRELQILLLIAAGHSSLQIAGTLDIKKFTVDTHRKNILKKTNCTSTYELISKSINEGWL